MSRRKSADKVEKFHYSPEDLVASSGWCIEDYRLAEEQRVIDRNERKEENASSLAVFWELIEETNCVSFWSFLKLIYTQYPELKVLFVANERIVKDAIYSRANDIAAGFADMDYNEVCKHLKASQAECLELQRTLEESRVELRAKVAQNTKLEERILELETIFEQESKLTNSLIAKNQELSSWLHSDVILPH